MQFLKLNSYQLILISVAKIPWESQPIGRFIFTLNKPTFIQQPLTQKRKRTTGFLQLSAISKVISQIVYQPFGFLVTFPLSLHNAFVVHHAQKYVPQNFQWLYEKSCT